MSVPLALAAPRAVAPLGPVAPDTVEAGLHRASFRVARPCDGELTVAGFPAVAGEGEDLARALPLASAAVLGASGPVTPGAKGAIGRASSLARPRDCIIGARVARPHLLQRGHVAVLPVARREDLDVAVALVHPEAAPRAEGPVTPLGELAVRVRRARGLRAGLVLVSHARDGPAALVGVHLDAPAPHGEGAATGGRAALPLLPLAPLAVDTLLAAVVRVARRRLALCQGFAGCAPVLRQRLDGPVPALQAAPATGCACGPVGPQAPLAVGEGAHAVLADAWEDLVQGPFAALAVPCVRV
mmetsp:Transcript_95500/g.294608  ORF Transcript_95500/g.294608 Transcript_95500/m.294608 type:complete len:300 (-) Transcript_95500:1139-2038(-)